MAQVRVGDVVADYTLAVREINGQVVSRYAHAMRQGDTFPPIVIDKNTMRLIVGFHRFAAYKSFQKPDLEVPAILKEFKNETEMLIYAAGDNRRNGYPMTTFEQKNIHWRLNRLGVEEVLIAETLGLSVDKLKTWSADSVIVGKDRQPLKRGLKHMRNQKVKPEVYEDIKQHYSGWNVTFHANQIIKQLKNNTLDPTNEEQNTVLGHLGTMIVDYLASVEDAA